MPEQRIEDYIVTHVLGMPMARHSFEEYHLVIELKRLKYKIFILQLGFGLVDNYMDTTSIISDIIPHFKLVLNPIFTENNVMNSKLP